MPTRTTPYNLTCEYLSNPLGLDVSRPRLAWKLPSGMQSAYQIEVSTNVEFGEPDLWESGMVESNSSNQIEYEGRALEPIERAWWRVRIWNESGMPGEWSQPAFWEAGLSSAGHWTGAHWISRPSTSLSSEKPPAVYLRKSFLVEDAPKRSRLFLSAKGVYRAYLNGERIGVDDFAPGWTDYHRRIPYQAYDLEGLLNRGENVLGIVLGDGWYCGNVCWFGRKLYGPFPEALAKLYIERSEAEPIRVVSDLTWKASDGPIRGNDLLMGETVDMGKSTDAWNKPGFDDSSWKKVATAAMGQVPVVGKVCQPVQEVQVLNAQSIEQANGKWLVDMGQNMVGRLRLRVSGAKGTKIQMRHAEILDRKGKLYTKNLRKAKQIDTFALSGEGVETFEPTFTFHGFRYAEISGCDSKPEAEGVVLSSVKEPIGHFRCGNQMVNQLVENIRWGMMGNYLEVPTDCPQRDERLGWMGDAQIFAPTAAYNFDIAAFMTKWLQDVRDAQSDDGAFPNVAPQILQLGDGAPAWADAGVIVPWTIYRFYGDKRILEQSWHSMVRYIEMVERANPDLIWKNRSSHNFGDWLNVNSETPKEVLATAYFAHSTSLVSKAARVLGRNDEAARFEKLDQRIRKAFQKAFVKPDGAIEGDTQTAYVLAMRFDLLTPSQREKAAQRLVADIEKRGNHLSTGFLGVGHLLPVMTEIGRDDVALKLLLNETFPSWGYSIKHGATTIWERWDGWTEDKGFQDPGMNSFNHYALGSCGEWLFSRLAGIDLDPAIPGFKRFVLNPLFAKEIGWVEASYESPYGKIVSNWKMKGDQVDWQVEIPPNSEAIAVPREGKILAPGRYSLN